MAQLQLRFRERRGFLGAKLNRAPVPSFSRRGGRAGLRDGTLPYLIGAAGVVHNVPD
jgi:hypothetical protein